MTLKFEHKLSEKETAVSETELWDKFRSGNERSYIEIYDRYVHVLYRYGVKLNKDGGLVKDCIQELFIDLWKKNDRLGPTNSIKFYLLRSLRRKIHRSIPNNSFTETLDNNQDVQLQDPSFEETLIASQDTESRKLYLRKIVETLPKRQKEAIFLRYFEGLSHNEIAEVMCISKTSVYMLICRSIETLRKSFLLLIAGLIASL